MRLQRCGAIGKIRIVESRDKAKGWEIVFGQESDDENLFSGLMWACNGWLFCDDKERLTLMVNDIIEELTTLDMDPKMETVVVDKHLQRR